MFAVKLNFPALRDALATNCQTVYKAGQYDEK
jgi:hypothetical protein